MRRRSTWLASMALAALIAAAAAPSAGAAPWRVSWAPDRTGELHGVAAVARDDAWAVGSHFAGDPIAAHWDGSSWHAVAVPGPGETGELEATAFRSANDGWAVGVSQSSTGPIFQRALIERWDGSAWSVAPSPSLTGGDSRLDGLALAGARAWAVGQFVDTHTHSLVERFSDGWQVVPAPDPEPGSNAALHGVATVGGDVWAVGSQQLARYDYDDQALILHRSGGSWHFVSLPRIGLFSTLLAIGRVPGTGQLWAVGWRVDCCLGRTETLALRYRSGQWSVVPTANRPQDRFDNLLDGVAAAGPNDVWAVGDSNDRNGVCCEPLSLVEHFDGTRWSIVASPNPRRGTAALFGVAVEPGGGRVWGVGETGSQNDAGPGLPHLLIESGG
jgi:hypothetical protein